MNTVRLYTEGGLTWQKDCACDDQSWAEEYYLGRWYQIGLCIYKFESDYPVMAKVVRLKWMSGEVEIPLE